MRFANPILPDPSFITIGIKMAQSTFSDVMPSYQYPSTPATVSRLPAASPARGKSLISAMSDWLYRQQVAEREAYLAKATDIFDLERRMRDFDRRPCY
jgi:Protein of unknown function (DUF3563)